MINYENDCVDCGFPCIHEQCRYYKELACYCDKCGDRVSELYQYGEMQLCQDCLLDITHIELSNY